jgi:membrane-associated phospholipid phosphatase
MIITCGIALLFYFLWPVVITRPDYSVPGFGSVLMRWLTSVDQPANTFPSGHTFFAILAALWVQHSSVQRFVKISVWGLCVVVAASTILVGQHYYWDIAGGVVVGWIGYLTAIKILPTSQ